MLRRFMDIGRRQFSTITPLRNEVGKKNGGGTGTGAFFLGKSLENFTSEPEIERVNIGKRFQKNFTSGTTYDPFDFSMAKLYLERKKRKEIGGFKKTIKNKKLNPLDFYTNPKFLSNFMTSTGKIYHRDVTKLTEKNQKRLTVAIKRSRNAGLLSSVHKDVSFLSHRHNN